MPMKNPRAGDYMLSKTASTEGIASKKSLELKKRYLLGCDVTGGPGALMKSDSTSVLDSKFRNFHSNISECQKLLNPNGANVTTATAIKEDHPKPLQLAKSETVISVPAAIVSKYKIATKLSSKELDSMKNSNEKENVYGKFVKPNNKLNPTTTSHHPINETDNENNLVNQMEHLPSEIILDLSAVCNIESAKSSDVSPENKAKKELDDNVIDLVTPSPKSQAISISDSNEKDDDVHRQILQKNHLYRKLNYSDNIEEELQNVIDLTSESPLKDETTSVGINTQTTAERNKTTIDSIIKRGNSIVEIRKTKSLDEEAVQSPRSPIYDETYINVPQIPWKVNSKAATDVESDSLSSSTTSSVDDIPHFVFDSTTSPDTLPADADRFVTPRLEIRDTSGELMQIDSLMIIDGKFVGDPEDLQYMEMPAVEKKESVISTPTTKEPSLRESKVKFDDSFTLAKSNICSSVDIPTKPKPLYKYESNRKKGRHELRFDTHNENKIDTLKNIPLILPQSSKSTATATTPIVDIVKPNNLLLNNDQSSSSLIFADVNDGDKTPLATTISAEFVVSDSETEITGPVLTETELSDWNADDAVSENFVDIEFVLNSNKGTIRRNKKSRKKQQLLLAEQQKLAKSLISSTAAPLAQDLDFDSIQFMDTGSEESCLETYSATNKALLKNRGYVQFVDTTGHNSKSLHSYKSDAGYGSSPKDLSEPSPVKPKSLDLHEAVNAEVFGIDYIEQGACILLANDGNSCCNETINDLDVKTPMNEVPPIFNVKKIHTIDNHPPESLQEIEEDSLLMIASQGTTTTEDSDALTVVTSPVDSTSPPKECQTNGNTPIADDKNTISHCLANTGSIISKTTTTTTEPIPSFKIKQLPQSSCDTTVVSSPSLTRSEINLTNVDDTYSDYVRKLQMKISKISSVHVDSNDARKIKRKHSKCDLSCCNVVATITSSTNTISDTSFTTKTTPTTTTAAEQQLRQMSVIDKNSNKPSGIYVNNDIHAKVNERIEEITKERTKQKDLIHDLVMDKLLSKKQLNAEKRLNRSRNRNLAIFSSPPHPSIRTKNNNEIIDTFRGPPPLTTTAMYNSTPLSEFSPNYCTLSSAIAADNAPLSQHYFTPKTNTINKNSPSIFGQIETKYKDLRPISNYY